MFKTITSDIRYCPLIKKKCIQDSCMFWVDYINEDKTRFKSCAFIINIQLQSQSITESVRIQGSVDKFNNQIHATVVALQKGMEVPELSGNSDKDVEIIRKLGG